MKHQIHDFTTHEEVALNKVVDESSRVYKAVSRVHKWLEQDTALACYVNIIREESSDAAVTEVEHATLKRLLHDRPPEVHYSAIGSSWGYHLRTHHEQNQIFLKQMLAEKLQQAKPIHARTLGVTASVTYAHELAHWIGTAAHGIDWRSRDDLSVAGIVEAGFYVEHQLFGGQVLFYGPSKWQIHHIIIKTKEGQRLEIPPTILNELLAGTVSLPLDTTHYKAYANSKGYKFHKSVCFGDDEEDFGDERDPDEADDEGSEEAPEEDEEGQAEPGFWAVVGGCLSQN